ncbi:carbohydrate-binding domain-containing protein [Alkalicoccus daliensis]|uniref:cellulase n=1 Tax=Alkalicoccus daliensis TaxID=745820 RepID=A0A1H0L774_9BACI|nr:carbohydrate-binding domain-containing protein [Alkalicoccus daliensis]SDO64077.1 endoglucanase [Alkalicoccus daliensis]
MKITWRYAVSTIMAILLFISVFSTASFAENDSLLQPPDRKPSEAGALQLVDHEGQRTLAGADGQPIQLKGMSTHGLQWFGEIVNNNAFAALANDWDSNVIRLALYVGENGYATNPELKDKVIEGIELAIENDMYVIIDWHVHHPGDPNADIYSGAMDFFDEISSLYPNHPNLIYELANEPNPNSPGVTNDAAGWQAVKDYADPIVDMLRAENAKENIIIVGSPNWSQRPDLAADNPIDDENTMYTVHFYTGTHATSETSEDRENVMSNARYALENGVAVFATEWGTSQADGNNGPYIDEADEWLTFLAENNISWANWSLTNKNETSGSFVPFELNRTEATSLDPGDDQVWAPEELSLSGEYVRSRIKGIPYEPIDRTLREPFTEVLFDFEDSTQGFVVNADSPVQDVTLSHVNHMLEIDGLEASSDVSEGNYWANLRISADEAGLAADIAGAEELNIQLVAEAPDTVAIAAIPQSQSTGWINPDASVIVSEADFTERSDGLYEAELTIDTAAAPALSAISTHQDDTVMTNVVLFVGTASADTLYIDQISVSGDRAAEVTPVNHAPLGEAALPSTFDDGTRQGWDWQGGSGVKAQLDILEVNDSQALSWEFAYPEVKPSDAWATAPRIQLRNINAVREEADTLKADLYIEPVRAQEGSMIVNLAMAPPELGFWAQAVETVEINFEDLSQFEEVEEGIYHVSLSFDLLTLAEGKVLAPDTVIRDFEFILQDEESDFAGRVYLDNVRFGEAPTEQEPTPEPNPNPCDNEFTENHPKEWAPKQNVNSKHSNQSNGKGIGVNCSPGKKKGHNK